MAWNISSTAVGGGVAEMVRSLLAYARGLGVDARGQPVQPQRLTGATAHRTGGRAPEGGFAMWGFPGYGIDDGRIELDTNTVERSIRPLALNRKNTLFAGSDEGGDNWAVIATLIENCKLGSINPHGWLTQTLTALANGHPRDKSDEAIRAEAEKYGFNMSFDLPLTSTASPPRPPASSPSTRPRPSSTPSPR